MQALNNQSWTSGKNCIWEFVRIWQKYYTIWKKFVIWSPILKFISLAVMGDYPPLHTMCWYLNKYNPKSTIYKYQSIQAHDLLKWMKYSFYKTLQKLHKAVVDIQNKTQILTWLLQEILTPLCVTIVCLSLGSLEECVGTYFNGSLTHLKAWNW